MVQTISYLPRVLWKSLLLTPFSVFSTLELEKSPVKVQFWKQTEIGTRDNPTVQTARVERTAPETVPTSELLALN